MKKLLAGLMFVFTFGSFLLVWYVFSMLSAAEGFLPNADDAERLIVIVVLALLAGAVPYGIAFGLSTVLTRINLEEKRTPHK